MTYRTKRDVLVYDCICINWSNFDKSMATYWVKKNLESQNFGVDLEAVRIFWGHW